MIAVTLEKIKSDNTYSNLFGMAVMLCFCLSFQLMSSLAKYVSRDLNIYVIVFFRNLFSFLIIIPIFLFSNEKLTTNKLWVHVIRAIIGTSYISFIFYGLSFASLNMVTAIGLTTPLFSVILAVLFLGERIGVRRIVALFIGFTGAIITLAPWNESFDHRLLWVVLGAFICAIQNNLVSFLGRTQGVVSQLIYMSFFMVIVALPQAYLHWQTPALGLYKWLCLLGCFYCFNLFAASTALRYANLVLLMPLDFSKILFASILSIFIFGQYPQKNVLIGACIILLSTIYITWREAKIKENHEQAYLIQR